MPDVHLVAGPHRSTRHQLIEELLWEHWGRAILLVPTRRLVRARRSAFMDAKGLPGVMGKPFQTFEDLASGLLEQEGVCADTLSDFQRRLLIDSVIANARSSESFGTFAEASRTPGFASHALRVITQLKQAAVEPAHFTEKVRGRPHASNLDEIVSRLYTDYQDAVVKTGVYDRVGVMWEAATLFSERRPLGLADVDLLLLDGFDDFTPSEFRLIRVLADHVSKLVFGVACNWDDPSQLDLYALPRMTARMIQDKFPNCAVVTAESGAIETASAFAARQLFWRSPTPAPSGLRGNLTLIEYRDVWAEVEATGRAIKTLLLDGVKPERVGLMHRDLDEVAPVIRSVFTEFGIPCAVSALPTLRESALCAFVLELIESTEEWDRERVAAILASRWLSRALDKPLRDSAPFALARAAEVVQGYGDWTHGLNSLRARLDGGGSKAFDRLRHTLPDPLDAADDVIGAVGRLAELAGMFKRRDTLLGYVRAAQALLGALQPEQLLAEAHAGAESIARAEQASLESLRARLHEWEAWLMSHSDAEPIARAEFTSRLRRVLRDTTLPLDSSNAGVQCLGMEDARHLTFDHVFIIGLNEGTVPRSSSVNAIYGRDDVDQLTKLGIPIDRHDKITEREMLLFHQSLDAAAESLTLSWHSMDARSRAKAPSPFIADIESVFQDETLTRRVESEAYPPPSAAASAREMAAACVCVTGPLPIAPAYALRIASGAAIEKSRLQSAPFDAADGVIGQARLQNALAAAFGIEHGFSVNQIETYADCPFRFFMERVLDVAESESPETAIDARARGVLLHDILRAFHESFPNLAIPEIDPDLASERMRACVEAAFERLLRRGSPSARALNRVECERVAGLLERHLRHARQVDDPAWKPAHFEVAFGRTPGKSSDALSRNDYFELDCAAGPVRFSGQIDRIDAGPTGTRIVDFKTSVNLSKTAVRNGESMQLPIYALALDAMLLPDRRCAEAVLIKIGTKDRYPAFEAGGDWTELAANVRERVSEIVSNIRAGYFPPTSKRDGCFVCKQRRACRYEQARIERKAERG